MIVMRSSGWAIDRKIVWRSLSIEIVVVSLVFSDVTKLIQFITFSTFAYTPGKPGIAQSMPQEVIPIKIGWFWSSIQIRGPPLHSSKIDSPWGCKNYFILYTYTIIIIELKTWITNTSIFWPIFCSSTKFYWFMNICRTELCPIWFCTLWVSENLNLTRYEYSFFV